MLVPLCFAALAVSALPSAHAQGSVTTDRNIRAQDFRDTFGANIHLGDNAYADTQALVDALSLIGFARVRVGCADDTEVAAWKEIARKAAPHFPAGLKGDVIVLGYLNAPDVTFVSQQTAIAKIPELIETLEGPNEINLYAVGNGAHGPFDFTDQTTHFPENYVAWAKAMADWKAATPSLSRAKLIAPTIASGDPADYARLSDVSPYVFAGNLHFYAGDGRQPSNFGGGNFVPITDWYRAAATPNKPVVVSEWGQTTAGKSGQQGCDEATQAKYILNQMFDIAAKGIYRAYLYQLMDDTADGDPKGTVGTEAHFGIFNWQWQPKPAARALAVVKTLLTEKTTRFRVAVPRYSVHGVQDAGAAGSSLSISKRDGSTLIVVWNEPQIWDPEKNVPVSPTPNSVKVSFGRKYAYRVFDPLHGTKPIAVGQAMQISVTLTGSPLMIEVR